MTTTLRHQSGILSQSKIVCCLSCRTLCLNVQENQFWCGQILVLNCCFLVNLVVGAV